MCVCVLSHVWLFCYPVDCSLPGSSVHEIFPARILPRVAISFSRGSSWPRDWSCIFCISCIAGGFFYSWVMGKPHNLMMGLKLVTAVPDWTLERNSEHCAHWAPHLWTGGTRDRSGRERSLLWYRPQRLGPMSPGMLRLASLASCSGGPLSLPRVVGCREREWPWGGESLQLEQIPEQLAPGAPLLLTFLPPSPPWREMLGSASVDQQDRYEHLRRKGVPVDQRSLIQEDEGSNAGSTDTVSQAPGSGTWETPAGAQRGGAGWRRNCAPLLFLGHLTW